MGGVEIIEESSKGGASAFPDEVGGARRVGRKVFESLVKWVESGSFVTE
jgi:hypothetical protein